jgi:NTP pyrophosphatase (non-canonical NTP hydrolase)
MGLHKNEGNPAAALSEECGEVIQIISKLYRFGGDWAEVPPGKNKSRWEQLEEEMSDLFYQWNRLRTERGLK